MSKKRDLKQDAVDVHSWILPRVDGSSNSPDLDVVAAIHRIEASFAFSVEEAWELRENEGFHYYGGAVQAAFRAGFRLARGEQAGDEDEDDA